MFRPTGGDKSVGVDTGSAPLGRELVYVYLYMESAWTKGAGYGWPAYTTGIHGVWYRD